MAAWTAQSHWRTRPAHEKGDVMRTLRLALAGAATLTLLAGLGGAVLAQDDEHRPVVVTGLASCTFSLRGT